MIFPKQEAPEDVQDTISNLKYLKEFVRFMLEAENGNCSRRTVYERIARETGIEDTDIIEKALKTLSSTDPQLISLLENYEPDQLLAKYPNKVTEILNLHKNQYIPD